MSDTRRIRAASVQFQSHPYDLVANMAIMRSFIETAAAEGVQIIAFPECCLTGYWSLRNLPRNELAELAEPVPRGNSTKTLLELSQTYRMVIGAGLIEMDTDGTLYNSYVVTEPDGTVHCHRKLHAFIHRDIASGESYTVFDTSLGVRVGILICYDNNIVENARMNALMGAEILLSPHQTGGCASRSPHAMKPIDPKLWQQRDTNRWAIEAEFKGPSGREWLLRWLPARAHDNGLFILFSNGVGLDDDEVRTGNAMILDPYGRIVNETWKAENDHVTADLDLELIENSTGRRWLQARRPDLYSPLTQPTGSEKSIRDVRFGPNGQSSTPH